MLSSAQPAQPHEKGPPPRATQVSEENALEGDDCSAITLGSLAPLIWGIQVDRRAGPSAKVAHGPQYDDDWDRNANHPEEPALSIDFPFGWPG
jgi:hypothetical protein